MRQRNVGARILADALELRPVIADLRRDIERTGLVPPVLISALMRADIMHMWMPEGLGGPELSITEFIRVAEAVSYADSAVGWCVGLAAAYTRFGGLLPEAVARMVFDGNCLAGSLAPTGRGAKVPGGYRVTGRWAWGSGILHSKWIITAFLTYADDVPVLADGKPEMRIGFFPKDPDVKVLDTWHVGGMRGTGSHDYTMSDVFIPDDFTVGGLDPPSQQPGRLYRIPVFSLYPFVIAATPLGVVRAAFDAFLELATVKTPVTGSVLLRDKPTVQAMVGRSKALLDSAREFYYATAQSLSDWADTDAPLSLALRTQVRLATAHVGEVAKQVVRDLYDAGGGSSVYETCPLEGHFRDIHAVTQHFGVSQGNFEFAGRVVLGLDPGTARF
jgi:alkylation response protein AidB-like acyl-CoA dehydrogenase